MDFEEKITQLKNPRTTANIFSRLTFFYMIGIIKETLKKSFNETRIYQTPPEFQSHSLGFEFEKHWYNQAASTKSKKGKEAGICRLMYILIKMFYKRFLCYYIFYFIVRIFVTVYKPILVGKIVAHFMKPDANIYYLGFGLVFTMTVYFFVFQHFIQVAQEICLQASIALTSMVYRKALKLRNGIDKKMESEVGNGVTLITKDVLCLNILMLLFYNGIISILTIVLQIFAMYKKVGWVGLLAIVVYLVVILINLFCANISRKIKFMECIYSAQRLTLLREAFSFIRTVKMTVLEDIVTNKCNEYRQKEIKNIMNIFFLRMGNFVLGKMGCTSSFIIVVSVYSVVNETFSAENVFFLMASMEMLKPHLSFILPLGIVTSAESLASLKRLTQFFSLEEFECEKNAESNIFDNPANNPKIVMENFCLKFDERSILNKINFKINDKGLLIVTGSACSGKSALLKAILGEFGLNLKGIIVKGSVSYASQEPWIFPGSIRQNILFGQEFNEKRYQDVIARCALEYDFQQFQNGDETFVVDNGNNLSKGQKIRINLARAIYRERQIYLLDSVLTSLDVNTSQHIFNRVMKEFMKDKICILINDNSNYFNDANQILELSKNSAKLIKNENSVVDIIQRDYTVANQMFSNKALKPGINDINDESTRLLENICNPEKKTYNYQEYNIDGNIKLETFKMYAKLCSGYWIVAGVLILFILSESFSIINNRFLSNWITIEEKYISFLSTNQSKEKNDSFAFLIIERRQNFQIFIGSFILHFILFSSAAVGCFVITLQASRVLHNKMLKSVINAKMDFFCSTLIGTLLNRFSIDVTNVDEKLPFYVFCALVIIFDSIGLFVIVALLKSIFIAPTLIIVVFGMVFMKLVLLPAITKAKRLESALHSPMEGYLNNTLNGLSTIRVLGPGQEKLIEEFDQYQDKFATASFILICSERTLKIFLQIISIGLLIFILCYFFLTEGNTPGDVGLGIVKALVIITTINYTFTDYMIAESLMSSLERISHYLKIDQENRTGLDLTKDWPQEGTLKFKNVNLVYKSTNEYALNDINLDIKAHEKVALIGRTGSGKSSLVSCIFRLYNFSGHILLDNIDIQHLGLDYLRSRFGIVSQDALILSGTLRENIDPFNEFSDNDILKAASSIIKDFKIFGLGKNKNHDMHSFDLNLIVNENTLTPSEKQIISLLRVLLLKKSIIILDEVSGNLDEDISDNIEKVIEEQCKNKTVITIVHKLKNIEHKDKICVLEDGRIIEFDTPSNLLNNPNSYFREILNNIVKKEI